MEGVLRSLASSVSSQLTTFTLAEHSLSSFQWPSCPHRAHGNVCSSLPSWALRSSDGLRFSKELSRSIHPRFCRCFAMVNMAPCFLELGLQLVLGSPHFPRGRALPRPLHPGPLPLGQSTLLTVLDATEHEHGVSLWLVLRNTFLSEYFDRLEVRPQVIKTTSRHRPVFPGPVFLHRSRVHVLRVAPKVCRPFLWGHLCIGCKETESAS